MSELADLKAPCIFCRYKGERYWQSYTHATGCPWYKLAGVQDRKDALRGVMEGLLASPPGHISAAMVRRVFTDALNLTYDQRAYSWHEIQWALEEVEKIASRSEDSLMCIFCKGMGPVAFTPERRALAKRVVETQRNDTRTLDEKLRDGANFVAGPGGDEGTRGTLSPATPSDAVTVAQQIIDRYRNNIYQDDLEEVILAREVLRLLKEREMVAFDHRMAFGALEDEKRLQANLSPSHAQAEVNAALRDSRFVRLLTYPPVDDQQGRL